MNYGLSVERMIWINCDRNFLNFFGRFSEMSFWFPRFQFANNLVCPSWRWIWKKSLTFQNAPIKLSSSHHNNWTHPTQKICCCFRRTECGKSSCFQPCKILCWRKWPNKRVPNIKKEFLWIAEAGYCVHLLTFYRLPGESFIQI